MFRRLIDRLIRSFNDMRPRQLLILASIAAGLMFLAIYFGLNSIASKNADIAVEQTPPPVVEEKVAVVVAKVNIPPRTRIQEAMLQMKELPVSAVPEGAIKSFDDVKNVQIKVSIFAGDIITIQKIFAEGGDEGFTGSIPSNCRAISINVNDVTGVAGFAKPGDRVDLLLVEKGKNSVTSNLLLQNVPLLSINQDTGGSAPVGENGVPSAPITNPTIATFALPPKDILKLISASKLGEIYLSLRPAKPQSTYVEAMEYTIDSIDAPAREPVSASAPVIPSSAPLPQIPAAPVTPVIEIIEGDKVKTATPTAPSAPNNVASAPTTNQPLPVIPSNGYSPNYSAPNNQSAPAPSPPIVNPPANN